MAVHLILTRRIWGTVFRRTESADFHAILLESRFEGGPIDRRVLRRSPGVAQGIRLPGPAGCGAHDGNRELG
ncbi:MAG: hypothetical protein D6753_17395 [Planctomycetota bacterium]|nr:MAG: hypothetical protein D6753_17395 [Planctomycetota bacterium]